MQRMQRVTTHVSTRGRGPVVWAVGILILLASPAVALGANQGDERLDESRAHAAGIVLAVDPEEGRLSLEEASLEAETFSFLVDEQTRVLEDGRAIELAAIAVGDPVSVEYAVSPTGERRAETVEVLTAPSDSESSR